MKRCGLIINQEKKGKLDDDDDDDDDFPRSKLLVRTLKKLEPNKKCGVEFNFHLIDLKKKKIELNYIPAIPMMKGAAIGKMAMLESESDSCIYILGNVLNPIELNQNKENYEVEEEEEDMILLDRNSSQIHCHCASSKYSFVSKRWDAFDVPFQTNGHYTPATLFGKLYFFGAPGCPLKVFENGWKDLELPDHLIDRKVAFPVIPDPINNRFLVHFFDSGDIYAFSDATATATTNWTCVVHNFYKRWTPPVAVSGNILFFHVSMLPYLVIAYDMSTDKWFEIVADFSRVDATLSLFDYMFTLPENHDVLCLASRLRRTPTDPAAVGILRLRFNHIIASNYLILTALDYQSYDIPIPSTVYDFLLL